MIILINVAKLSENPNAKSSRGITLMKPKYVNFVKYGVVKNLRYGNVKVREHTVRKL